MWNFILYNDFNNEEIRRLHNEVNSMDKTLKKLTDDNSRLYDDNCFMKRKLDKIKENSKDKPVRKKRKINHLKNEFNKQNKRIKDSVKVELTREIKNKKLINIFSSLENISDIINLKDNEDKFHFMNDKKFLKLYNLIPALEELDKIIGMENVKNYI